MVELVVSTFFEDPGFRHWAHLSTGYVSLRVLGGSKLRREDLYFDTGVDGAFFVVGIVHSRLEDVVGLNNFDKVVGVVDIDVTPDAEIVELFHELLDDPELAYVFLTVGFEGCQIS